MSDVDLETLSTLLWDRMSEVSVDQAGVLLDFAKGAVESEADRSGIVEQKATWTMATAVAMTTAGVGFLGWIGDAEGSAATIVKVVMVLSMAFSVGGGIVAFFGAKLRWDWSQVRPASILHTTLRTEIEAVDLRRRVASHYFDVYEGNRSQTEERANAVMWGQLLMTAGVLVGVVTAAGWSVVR